MDRAIDASAEISPAQLNCENCGRNLRRGWAFVFKGNSKLSGGALGVFVRETPKCIFCAIRHPPMARRSFAVAVVVGTILTGLNQGEVLVKGEWQNALYWKIPLTYCVPYLVATFGALTNIRR